MRCSGQWVDLQPLLEGRSVYGGIMGFYRLVLSDIEVDGSGRPDGTISMRMLRAQAGAPGTYGEADRA